MKPVLSVTYEKFKSLNSEHGFQIYYTADIDEQNSLNYYSLMQGTQDLRYNCVLSEETDRIDFEQNFKSSATQVVSMEMALAEIIKSEPIDECGKVLIRAESRPIDCTTWFSTRCDKIDSPQKIGGGKRYEWDFSNSDDNVSAPSGFKRKRLEGVFMDGIYVKEGTVYFHNKLKGSYFDFYIVCPAGGYYIKNDGSIAQAIEDTIVYWYVVEHPMQGSVPMGDELNTETCSQEVPAGMKFVVEITVPEADNSSNGIIEIEVYRQRTVIL